MKTLRFGSGRISDIIYTLQKSYDIEDVTDLPENTKLNTLIHSLQLTRSEFDNLISNNSPVLRTVKGHAFETVFKYIVEENGYHVEQVGGDSSVDLIVNGYTLQLKTPNMAGTRGFLVQYKTHKTHGAKSEQESIEYYHDIQKFAHYLVGLISYDPFKIIILNHNELPRHPHFRSRIISPFTIKWDEHVGINNFERIGISNYDARSRSHLPINLNSELLPNSCRALNLKSEIIIDTILADGNFRIWDMSIRGFAREIAVKNLFKKNGIDIRNPVRLRTVRGDKADIAVNISGQNVFFQIKGVSTNNCKFRGKESIVATETQLTRGRVNNHPTQSRLYLKTDFDYLILALDPPLVQLYEYEYGNSVPLHWKLFFIPTDELREHSKITNRLNSLQKFKYGTLLKYEINDKTIHNLLK